MDYRKIISSGPNSLFPFSLVSRNSSETHALVIAVIYTKRRNARCENNGENDMEHVTRPLTESIREKSRVGQLTRRRAISGSERGIKGAWELWREDERGRREGMV